MSLKIYQFENYENTHEREQFDVLCEKLKDIFSKTEEPNLLFSNISFGSASLDALLIKPDAITVLEFKNYGGIVNAAENGDWTLSDGTIIKGGANGKNPFSQTKNNKQNVYNTLKECFNKPYVELGHISGVVVFNQPITIVDHLSPNVKSWFHITDMDHVVSKLKNLTSPKIRYTEKDIEQIPKIFNFDEIRDLIYPIDFEEYEEAEDESEDSNDSIEEKDFTNDEPAEFITEIDAIRQEYEYNGGTYWGSLNKEQLPEGEGEFVKNKNRYVGVFTQGEPNENVDFTVTSVDSKRPRVFVGTIKKDYSFNKGHLTISNPEKNEKKEYIGDFEGMDLKEGKYLKNGVLQAEGLCFVTVSSDGRKGLKFIPKTGHHRVTEFRMDNGSIYTGVLDSNNKPDDDHGVLLDKRGNKFVGAFVHGTKEGEFFVYIRNRSFAKRIKYKDDIEIAILD